MVKPQVLLKHPAVRSVYIQLLGLAGSLPPGGRGLGSLVKTSSSIRTGSSLPRRETRTIWEGGFKMCFPPPPNSKGKRKSQNIAAPMHRKHFCRIRTAWNGQIFLTVHTILFFRKQNCFVGTQFTNSLPRNSVYCSTNATYIGGNGIPGASLPPLKCESKVSSCLCFR